MIKLPRLKLRPQLLFLVVVFGLLMCLGSGTISNEPETGIPETRHYGYPLAWLIINLNGSIECVLSSLAIDFGFWVIISSLMLTFLEKLAFPRLGIEVNKRLLLLLIILCIPLGLAMDFVHESGHVLSGILTGGKLTYMKVAYLEIFPQLAFTPQFELGSTRVDGLPYGSVAYGFMLLGGSMMTNVISWVLGLIVLKIRCSGKTEIALKVLGLFGILDLPFYVVFPQLGLGHWIFFGGTHEPEPLIGARMTGLSDPAFYLAVFLSTVGLLMLYSRTLSANVLACARRQKHQSQEDQNSVPDVGS